MVRITAKGGTSRSWEEAYSKAQQLVSGLSLLEKGEIIRVMNRCIIDRS